MLTKTVKLRYETQPANKTHRFTKDVVREWPEGATLGDVMSELMTELESLGCKFTQITLAAREPKALKYSVGAVREAGLEAHWIKTRTGAPIINARVPGGRWYVIDARQWDRAAVVGVRQAFDEATALGEFFSIPA